jgi:hypothetical protein
LHLQVGASSGPADPFEAVDTGSTVGGASTQQVGGKQRGLFLFRPLFGMNMTSLPRQARDKHRKRALKKEDNLTVFLLQAFSSLSLLQVIAENALFAPFIYIYKRSFNQERLGTNIGKALKKRLSLAPLGDCGRGAARAGDSRQRPRPRRLADPICTPAGVHARGFRRPLARRQGAQNASFESFTYENDSLTKTGSGQT